MRLGGASFCAGLGLEKRALQVKGLIDTMYSILRARIQIEPQS